MQTITDVCNMSGSNIFIGGEQVFHAYGKECTQRNLKGERTKIDIIIATTARMEIDMIVPDTHAVKKISGFTSCGLSGNQTSVFLSHMFFENGKGCFYSSRFAYIRVLS